MATGRKPAVTAQQEKLTIKSRKGIISIDEVVLKKNINGKDYIATPHGAVYSRLDEVKPGLHMVVQLSNDMIALNRPNRQDIMTFLTEKKDETGWTINELRDFYGV